uniref:Omega-6 fatty acid desaturase endoplasmic reticulum isozyme 1-like n=1 Tax=Rhizophora mucronata TaxID=61149 RepID=A0A2P2N575_RHIMU
MLWDGLFDSAKSEWRLGVWHSLEVGFFGSTVDDCCRHLAASFHCSLQIPCKLCKHGEPSQFLC